MCVTLAVALLRVKGITCAWTHAIVRSIDSKIYLLPGIQFLSSGVGPLPLEILDITDM